MKRIMKRLFIYKMKTKYLITALINALPLIAISVVVWQWPNTIKIAFPPSLPTSLGEKLADSVPQNRIAPPTESWQVAKVTDGDTITVQQGSRKERIRFCGTDAPEKSQPLGQQSKANLQQLINQAGGEVQLSIIESDRYGRKVAEVFTVLGDGSEKFLQEEQVKAGLSYHYAKYSSSCPNRDAIIKAETLARDAHLGVWSSNYEKPWDYRRAMRN